MVVLRADGMARAGQAAAQAGVRRPAGEGHLGRT
jgi:hypothetical protein